MVILEDMIYRKKLNEETEKLFKRNINTITIKNYKFLIVMFPIVLSLLIVIAAPAIMGFTRYAFPVIYSVPFLFGCAENRKYKNDPERINVL